MRMTKRQMGRGKASVLDSFMSCSLPFDEHLRTRRGTNVPPQNNGLQPGMAM